MLAFVYIKLRKAFSCRALFTYQVNIRIIIDFLDSTIYFLLLQYINQICTMHTQYITYQKINTQHLLSYYGYNICLI